MIGDPLFWLMSVAFVLGFVLGGVVTRLVTEIRAKVLVVCPNCGVDLPLPPAHLGRYTSKKA